MSRVVLVLLVAVVVGLVPAAALSFSFSGSMGVESIRDETYYQISVTPDVALGSFGFGVDVTVHYRFDDGLSILEDDWVPDPFTFQETLGLYLAKLSYVRYGLKGEPLFVKLGSIEDATLGNGFIMGNYENTLFLPERRVFGLSLDVDGRLFGFPYVGIETHVGDLSAFDVMGARFFVRPLIAVAPPTLRDLQIGATVAVDRDPYRYDDLLDPPGDETIWLAGVDFRQPIIDSTSFSLALSGDVVTQRAEAYGGMLGLGGRFLGIFSYGAQVRFVGDSLVPVYFDGTYDITRAERYALAAGTPRSPGFVGWFATVAAGLLRDSIVFRASIEGPFGEVDPGNSENYLNYPRLRASFKVADALLAGLSLDASYDKLLIREPLDVGRSAASVIKAKLDYRADAAAISFFYLLRYSSNDWYDPEVSSGLETRVRL